MSRHRTAALLAGLLGLLWTLVLIGPAGLDPRRVDWLFAHPDVAQQYLGWAALRHDPHWHWPLASTEQIGWPQPTPLAYTASIPPVALAARLVSAWLPQPFQYFGLWIWLSFALLFLSAWRLHARLTHGASPASSLLAGAFAMLSPAAAFRANLCPALVAHWLLLLGVELYVAPPAGRWRMAASTAALAALGMATSPYFAPPLLLLAAALAWRWSRPLALLAAAAGAALGAVAFGIWSGGTAADYTRAGYRLFSLNLLGFVNPMAFRGLVPPWRGFPQQYEGYVYLGGGVLALYVLLSWPMWRQRRHLAAELRRHWPLVAAAFACVLLALTPRVTLGRLVLFDLPLPGTLERLLSIYRISGPLAWLPHHLLLLLPLVLATRLLGRFAPTVLAAALALQLADLAPRAWTIHAATTRSMRTPLVAPAWREIGAAHDRLIVLPAYQCGDSPGGAGGFATFGRLAEEQHLATNSVHVGREPEHAHAEHCVRAPARLAAGQLDPRAAYVVSPQGLWDIARSGARSHACARVDGFYLCTRSDAQLPVEPDAVDPIVALEPGRSVAVGGPGWSNAMLRYGWTTPTRRAVWGYSVARLVLRLPPTPAPGRPWSLRLSLSALQDATPQSYTILDSSGHQLARGTAATGGPDVHFDALVSVPSPGLVELELRAGHAVRPIDVGLGSDARALGIALHELTLVPAPTS